MFVGFDFEMKKLSRNRHITVYLPDNYYRNKKRYPVLYIQDGQNAFFDRLSYSGVSWGFLDYVKENGLEMEKFDKMYRKISKNSRIPNSIREYGIYRRNSRFALFQNKFSTASSFRSSIRQA